MRKRKTSSSDDGPAPKNLTEALLSLIWKSPRRFIILIFVVCGVILYGAVLTVPEQDRRDIFSGIVAPFKEARPDIEVAIFEALGDHSNINSIKAKIERNFVEFLSGKGVKVRHALASKKWNRHAREHLVGSVSISGDAVSISVSLVRKGVTISTIQFEDSLSVVENRYKSIPETLIYGMHANGNLDNSRSLKSVAKPSRARSTSNLGAYLMYLEATRLLKSGSTDDADRLLEDAISRDPKFAMAYWARGAIAGSTNAKFAEIMYARANALNPDHERPPLGDQISNPVPSLLRASSVAGWESLAEGVSYKFVESLEFKINISTWRINPKLYNFILVEQKTDWGEAVSDFRKRLGAILAVNAGFFEMDSENRLSPSGLFIIDGRAVHGIANRGGSAVLEIEKGVPNITGSKAYVPSGGIASAVQSGPMVVDPGGVNGIRENDYNRLDRSTFCINKSGWSQIIVVKGGLSLFEVGQILSAGESDGGFSCDRAINLDGGPSAQVSFSAEGRVIDLDGLWKVNGAIVVKKR